MNRLAALIIPVVLCLTQALPVHAEVSLPDIGTQANATLTLEDEYRLGSMVVRGLRDQGQILDDPEINEYLNSIGSKLVSQADTHGQQFHFFLVKDNEINAFALPGGFVGINAGLLLATRNENELAGVMAHEITHVTQRHIARSIAQESRGAVVSTAAMLAAILLGAAGGGDAALAGIAAAQSMALQNQMTFSRANETEADNIGIQLMARAGFDPTGMWQFFEVLQRLNGTINEADIPAILRNHPVTLERIAETRSRAAELKAAPHDNSLTYELMRERMRVLSTPSGEDPRRYYSQTNEQDPARLYGRALANMRADRADAAVTVLRKLVAQSPTVMQYHTALGQAQLAANNPDDATQTLAHAYALFPRNVPVTVRYADVLMHAGDAKRAHEVLLDLFNNVPPTPEQAKQIALAANAAGDVADAYSYMAEYHVMSGDLSLAVSQLQMALSVPQITAVQRSRFTARMQELQRAMPKRMRVSQPDAGRP